MEAGDDNITVETIERLVIALEGRFDVSISPREMHFPRWHAWWELIDGGVAATTPFACKGVVANDDGSTLRVLGGWMSGERQEQHGAIATTSSVAILGEGESNARESESNG